MKTMTALVAAAAIYGGLATAATAMPIAPVGTDSAAKIEQVRWVCGRYGHCWWRPNYYGGYYAYGPRPYYWRHRHWHRHYW